MMSNVLYPKLKGKIELTGSIPRKKLPEQTAAQGEQKKSSLSPQDGFLKFIFRVASFPMEPNKCLFQF